MKGCCWNAEAIIRRMCTCSESKLRPLAFQVKERNSLIADSPYKTAASRRADVTTLYTTPKDRCAQCTIAHCTRRIPSIWPDTKPRRDAAVSDARESHVPAAWNAVNDSALILRTLVRPLKIWKWTEMKKKQLEFAMYIHIYVDIILITVLKPSVNPPGRPLWSGPYSIFAKKIDVFSQPRC